MELTKKSALFISVIDGHKGIIHKIANAYAKNAENKKDLTQEIVLQLWKAFDNYNPQFKYSTWIYKVALNVSLAFYRKENNRAKVFNPLHEDIVTLAVPDDSGEREADFNHLQQFIAELKDLDRAILLLYLEEKSQKEMADIMGITETNISTRIGRIKSTLRQKFSQLPK
jgi:RNA polymerase sigma-70 factor (ECF subfamily)